MVVSSQRFQRNFTRDGRDTLLFQICSSSFDTWKQVTKSVPANSDIAFDAGFSSKAEAEKLWSPSWRYLLVPDSRDSYC